MPYIKREDKERVLGVFHHTRFSIDRIENEGELNYALSVLIDEYLRSGGGVNYAKINEVIGALECAKLEVYRRVAAPYEDRKIAENGDVYTCLD